MVTLSVDGANGDWWTLDLSGNGRGCNQLTGTCTVSAVEFGPQGYVKKLDAAFEQPGLRPAGDGRRDGGGPSHPGLPR
ncbi:hypothetical protein [Streptomyces sp. NRRL B-3229]|uniref:hypothetical protein n=1 Tax=Streptomyces sp. NRRL B-3229 TaxID=1463836 RepID=UPI0004BF8850|nr:hypothetical protein [Streptomyces sp. NRRL B-3229]